MMHSYTPRELAPLKISTSTGYRSVHTSPSQNSASPRRPRKDSTDSVDDVIAAIDHILISTSTSPHSPRSPNLDKPLPPRKMEHAATFPLTIRKRRASREDVHILRSASVSPPLSIAIPKPRTSQVSAANLKELNTLHAPIARPDLTSAAPSPMSCITDSDNCFSDLSSSAAASPRVQRPTSAPTPGTPGHELMPRAVSQITSCRIESVAMLDFPEFMPWGGEDEEEVLSPALEIDEGDWYTGDSAPKLPDVECEKEWVGEEMECEKEWVGEERVPQHLGNETANREWGRTPSYGGSDRIPSSTYSRSERIASPPPLQQYGRSGSPLALPRQSQQPLYPTRDSQPVYSPPTQPLYIDHARTLRSASSSQNMRTLRSPSPSQNMRTLRSPSPSQNMRTLRSPSPSQGYTDNMRTLRSPSPQVQIPPTDALTIAMESIRVDWIPEDADCPPPPPPKEGWREREREREMKMEAEFVGVSESRFSVFSIDEERKRSRSKGRWLGLKKR